MSGLAQDWRGTIGIGVITYNRAERLMAALDNIERCTLTPYALVVADDGSTDATLPLLRERRTDHLTGANRGVAWNKNRALFHLHQVRHADIVVLLEDDSYPVEPGWERAWIDAALRWGHVNLAGAWFEDSFLSGSGTAADPIRSRAVSAQASASSREALAYVGYMDTRFRRFGCEHVEHSRRMVRAGYGGRLVGGPEQPDHEYVLIRGGIHVTNQGSFHDDASAVENMALLEHLRGAEIYRAPWRGQDEFTRFRDEQAACVRYAAG